MSAVFIKIYRARGGSRYLIDQVRLIGDVTNLLNSKNKSSCL